MESRDREAAGMAACGARACPEAGAWDAAEEWVAAWDAGVDAADIRPPSRRRQ